MDNKTYEEERKKFKKDLWETNQDIDSKEEKEQLEKELYKLTGMKFKKE